MKIVVNKYSTDGTSLSIDRREQIVLVYRLCETMGDKQTTYKEIQIAALENKIFGQAKADSVIRTIFPLLKKIGFVEYPDNDSFLATSFFTQLGKAFVYSHIAWSSAQTLNNEAAVSKIDYAIQCLLQAGLMNLSKSSYREHNIMLALQILRNEKEIFWSELLYILTQIQNGNTLVNAIASAKANRDNNESYEYVSSKGSQIANTAYSYVRSFLIEAGVISNSKDQYSTVIPSAIQFLNSLPQYGNR